MRSSRSSSSASTRSNSSLPDAEATIPIFVKLLSGETIPITLPYSTPIATLLQLLSLRTSLPPSTLRLHLAGKHLLPTPSTAHTPISADSIPTLESLAIPPSSTLTLSLPLLGGMVSSTTTTASDPPTTASPSTSTSPSDPSPSISPTSTPSPSISSSSSSTASTSTPVNRKPRPQRCTHKSCNSPAQRIVGDCGFCAGHFCGRHRMLEDHKCAGLEDCKKESHERNADKLNSERTMVVRGI